MPELVLKPSIHDFDRGQVEEFLETIRVKRMSAAIEYHANKNAKLAHEQDKIQKKFQHQLVMLEKELERLEAADDKVQQRLINIDMLKQEMGLLTDSLVDITPDTINADED